MSQLFPKLEADHILGDRRIPHKSIASHPSL